MSYTAPLLLSTLAPPPLTVENILTAVQGVAWRNLGWWLFSGNEDYLDEIEGQYKSDDERLHALIDHWLQGEGFDEPSWRALIINLDWAKETKIAEKIQHFAEPVSGELSDTVTLVLISLSGTSFSVYIL